MVRAALYSSYVKSAAFLLSHSLLSQLQEASEINATIFHTEDKSYRPAIRNELTTSKYRGLRARQNKFVSCTNKPKTKQTQFYLLVPPFLSRQGPVPKLLLGTHSFATVQFPIFHGQGESSKLQRSERKKKE